MNIDIATAISLAAVLIALYSALGKFQREDAHDSREDGSQVGMILEKLANISLGIADLKTELSSLSSQQNELRERIARMETANAVLEGAIKRTNNRIDELMKG